MDEMITEECLRIGDIAPSFTANTTQGVIKFPVDFKGKWVVLFSHPGDFTPVCTTEIMTFAAMQPEFDKLNTQLLGLSVDSNPSHIDWVRNIATLKWKNMRDIAVKFSIIADSNMTIARMYGMIAPAMSTSVTVRNVYIINPNGIVKLILCYPLTTGRSIPEILRALKALQTSEEYGVATPADWVPGQDVIMFVPNTVQESIERQAANSNCVAWYLCFKKDPNAPLPPDKMMARTVHGETRKMY